MSSASASDVASWLGVAFGAISLYLAWRGFRRLNTAEAATREMQRRVRHRDVLDAFDTMSRHKADLERRHSAGNIPGAGVALQRWREAAQRLHDQAEASPRQDAAEARRALDLAIRQTQAMAGRGGRINVGAKTMGDAVSLVDD
jgi:hypothetical protein